MHEQGEDDDVRPLLIAVENFTLTIAEREILKQAKALQCRGKQKAANAVKHLDRSYKLCDIDREMAALRQYCALEEAAAALIAALGQQNYFSDNQIDWTSHRHCFAVVAFARIVEHVLHPLIQAYSPFVRMVDGKTITVLMIDGKEHYPDPPLEITRTMNDVPDHFIAEISALLQAENLTNFHELLRQEQDTRNRLLYATESHFSRDVVIGEERARYVRETVFCLITFYILVLQTDRKQSFVKQCVRSLKRMLKTDKAIKPTGTQ